MARGGDSTTGEVLVYVVRGAVEVELDGTVHALHEGDSLFFDGTVPPPAAPPRRRAARALLYVATG